MAEDENKPDQRKPMINLAFKRGTKGLEQYGGYISEEWLRRLQGQRGMKIYREMADNDDTVGAILFAIEMVLRNVEWRIEPFSGSPEHEDQALYVESLMNDMESTWEDFIAEVLTMLPYGYAPFEILYKRRVGPLEKKPHNRSIHSDGLIGWRDLAIRSQMTVERWEFDEDSDDVTGLWQYPPYSNTKQYKTVFIPIEKMVIFKTTSRRGNPEGRSMLRNAFISWFHKKRIAEAEAIGAERDLAGMPMFYLPSEWFDTDSPNHHYISQYQDVIENIRRDEQGGLLVPAQFDEEGNRIIEFKLASTEGTRLIDTDKIIKRYDVAIARTVLADFIMLGHDKVGSYALSDDKTEMFANALGGWLKAIAATLNRHALPKLYELNGWDPGECAEFVPGDIEKPDVERFTNAVQALTGSGYLTPGREEDENHFRKQLGMPEIPEGEERHPGPPMTQNQPGQTGGGNMPEEDEG